MVMDRPVDVVMAVILCCGISEAILNFSYNDNQHTIRSSLSLVAVHGHSFPVATMRYDVSIQRGVQLKPLETTETGTGHIWETILIVSFSTSIFSRK